MSLPALDLYHCWRCSGFLLFEPGVVQGLKRAGAPAYCKGCQVIADKEQSALPCAPGRRCVHVSYQSGPFAEMVVTEVDGDRVKVMRLGFPGGLPAGAGNFHHTIGREWYPRSELLMKGL